MSSFPRDKENVLHFVLFHVAVAVANHITPHQCVVYLEMAHTRTDYFARIFVQCACHSLGAFYTNGIKSKRWSWRRHFHCKCVVVFYLRNLFDSICQMRDCVVALHSAFGSFNSFACMLLTFAHFFLFHVYFVCVFVILCLSLAHVDVITMLQARTI